MSYPDFVFHSRAIRTSGLSIEDDPELNGSTATRTVNFMMNQIDLRGKNVLESG